MWRPGLPGPIGDFKDLPRAVRDFYVRENAVLPFLLLKDAL